MWEIIGHEREVLRLAQAVDAGTLPHALLITGPAGIGKTTLALELARTLNCSGPDRPCGVCVNCRQTANRSHPDVSLVERLEGKDSIAIGQVREFRESASLRPYQGRFRIVIVSGCESLTPQAADALLKILEEPPAHLVIVLTATDSNGLPATILSRSRAMPLQPADETTVAAALVERHQDVGSAKRLARLAHGDVGWALQAIASPKLAEAREELVNNLVRMLELDAGDRLQLAESLSTADRKGRSAMRRNLEMLLLTAHDLLLVSQGREPRLAVDRRADLERQAERLSLGQIAAYVAGIRTCMVRIDANVDPRLALEAALLAFP